MSQEAATARKNLFTPFNVVAGIIVIIGLIITVIRFTSGLAATSASERRFEMVIVSRSLEAANAIRAGNSRSLIASISMVVISKRALRQTRDPILRFG